MIRPALLTLATSLLASPALAGDWFVIVSMYEDQPAAWASAAKLGGWVLDHDLYDGLKADRWSVVYGPFAKPGEAQKQKRALQREAGYESAYAKEAGDLLLPSPIAAPGVPPSVVAALLGELAIQVKPMEPGQEACGLDVPYWKVTLGARDVSTKDPTKPRLVGLETGTTYVIDRATGQFITLVDCPAPDPVKPVRAPVAPPVTSAPEAAAAPAPE